MSKTNASATYIGINTKQIIGSICLECFFIFSRMNINDPIYKPAKERAVKAASIGVIKPTIITNFN